MSRNQWMIYGAYGYTGRRIAEEAVRRGHRPLLSGRSADKLTPVAERLGVDMAVLDLRDEDRLQSTLAEVRLVLNAAGPFIHTAHPIVQACLKTETNYLDVSGEAMVLEWILALDQQAQEREVAIIPGVGFNVLASDSLARYVTERLDSPTHLEIATWWTANGMSPGSTKTMIESFPSGTMARREGQLTRISARDGRRQQRSRLDDHGSVAGQAAKAAAVSGRREDDPASNLWRSRHSIRNDEYSKYHNLYSPYRAGSERLPSTGACLSPPVWC